MLHVSFRSASVLLGACLLLSSVGAAQEPPDLPTDGIGEAPYDKYDNIEGPGVDLATFPVRPMVIIDAAGSYSSAELWAVSERENSLYRVNIGTHVVSDPYPCAGRPVSVAHWSGYDNASGTSDDEILVVSRGNWTVTRYLRSNGALLRTHQLGQTFSYHGQMSEPGDILVLDATDMAFVSCSGADTVLQIDLRATDHGFVRVFGGEGDSTLHPKWKAPLFLSEGAEGKVYVAPLISGNNTAWDGGLVDGTSVVRPASPDDFPDFDLFLITPETTTTSGSVIPVARGMGTVMFAHGANSDGKYWMLNTDARNNIGTSQGEPSVRGDFARNRITQLASAPTASVSSSTTWSDPASPTVIPLDPPAVDGASPLSSGEALGQPFSLAFEPGTDNVAIAGLLTDNIALLGPTGTRLKVWSVAEVAGRRAIPRQVLLRVRSGVRRAFVYCWGENKIRVYQYDPVPSGGMFERDYPLGVDPTPAPVQRGRDLFFSAAKSLSNNASCATCHVEGGTDQLVWNLSNLPLSNTLTGEVVPLDDKGGMVTQTLIGIQRVAPFHWRGERDLIHFNLFAFDGLLGNPQDAGETPPHSLSPEDFADLQAYLFSLANPANPYEDRNRELTEAAAQVLGPGDATLGQTFFRTPKTFVTDRRSACIDCHDLPLGTNNDIVREQGRSRPRRGSMKVAPFHDLWRKHQKHADVVLSGTTSVERAMLGAGLAHNGQFVDIADFVNTVNNTNITGDAGETLSAFVGLFDTGTAPSVHYAFLLNSVTVAETVGGGLLYERELRDYLLEEARPKTEAAPISGELPHLVNTRHCDVIVVGTANIEGVLHQRRWFYRVSGDTSATPYFQCEDGTTRTLADFVQGASLSTLPEAHLFLGAIAGSGERASIDYDMDGLLNLASGESDKYVPSTTPPSPSGLPLFASGGDPAVRWKTSRAARISFETSDISVARVVYRPWNSVTGPWTTIELDVPSRVHSAVLTNLYSSTPIDHTTPIDPVNVDLTEYAWHVEVKRLSDSSWVVGSNTRLRPKPFTFPGDGYFDSQSAPGSPHDSEDFSIAQTHVIDASSVEFVSAADGWSEFRMEARIARKRAADFLSDGTLDRQPAPDRIVVGHVLHYDASNGETYVLDPQTDCAGPISSNLHMAHKASIVWVELTSPSSGEPTRLCVDGTSTGNALGFPFLMTRVASQGTPDTWTELSFRVPTASLGQGDKVTFVVDAVLHVESQSAWESVLTATGQTCGVNASIVVPTVYVQPPGTTDAQALRNIIRDFAFTQWSFGDTGETLSAPSYEVP